MARDEKVVLGRIKGELEKFNKKDFTLFFFTIDSKNVPNGTLVYEYDMALALSKLGYKVCMLYQVDNELPERQIKKMKAKGTYDKMDPQIFCGVEDWMGKEYADLPHLNISKENVWKAAPSDFLFIPEAFPSLMLQTYLKRMPCTRFVLLQNFDYATDSIPLGSQWANFGIRDCIASTQLQADMLHEVMPYIKTRILNPYIPEYFRKPVAPKKLVVNIISKKQSDVNKLMKTFYWKYPVYKFVSFKDLRGYQREHYADILKEGAITVWIDNDTPFGYGALEAMRCGNIVIGKVPENIQEWMTNENGELRDNVIWFDDMRNAPDILADVIASWMQDEVPEVIYQEMEETNKLYTKKEYDENVKALIEDIVATRKSEIETIMNVKENNLEKNNEE